MCKAVQIRVSVANIIFVQNAPVLIFTPTRKLDDAMFCQLSHGAGSFRWPYAFAFDGYDVDALEDPLTAGELSAEPLGSGSVAGVPLCTVLLLPEGSSAFDSICRRTVSGTAVKSEVSRKG